MGASRLRRPEANSSRRSGRARRANGAQITLSYTRTREPTVIAVYPALCEPIDFVEHRTLQQTGRDEPGDTSGPWTDDVKHSRSKDQYPTEKTRATRTISI